MSFATDNPIPTTKGCFEVAQPRGQFGSSGARCCRNATAKMEPKRRTCQRPEAAEFGGSNQ